MAGVAAAAIVWAGIKSGVLEAGARPNLIAAIGSGYLMALVKPKRAM
ncbi:unannotated protein [freshwater metagenome]|uniref:Unannotated protein n=1 Tax=freshwater metagenome TaxID=449393 RepID=A0A6J6RHZ5_9ZZZZ